MNTLILTGWGWMEYAVAAAVALKALGGNAEVRGISKKHLPGFLATEGAGWKRIYIIGVSLCGDEQALAETLKELRKRKVAVTWISGLDLTDSLRVTIAPLLKVQVFGNSSFNGALVKAVGEAFDEDVTGFLPFAFEKNKIPKSVPPYHELLSAAMYAHRIYQDEESYATAIRYLAAGVAESAWSPEMKRVVEHYRRYGNRELVGSSAVMKELRSDISRIAAHPEARVLILGESARARRPSPRRFTSGRRGATNRSTPSTARASTRSCWKAVSSDTRRARSPAPTGSRSDFSNLLTAERSSSTRSASCRWRRRERCSGSSRADASCGSVVMTRSRPMCAS